MKKATLLFIVISIHWMGFGQQENLISTMDFVQILDGQKEEALFYYKNNWEKYRIAAKEKGQIHSYQIMETPFSKEAPFHIILVTTYADKEQYDIREENFEVLIEQAGGLKLLNDKKPGDFRKNLFYKEGIKHL